VQSAEASEAAQAAQAPAVRLRPWGTLPQQDRPDVSARGDPRQDPVPLPAVLRLHRLETGPRRRLEVEKEGTRLMNTVQKRLPVPHQHICGGCGKPFRCDFDCYRAPNQDPPVKEPLCEFCWPNSGQARDFS